MMKRMGIVVPLVWLTALLASLLWSYLLNFRMPFHVAMFEERGLPLPGITRHMIDWVGGSNGTAAALGWAAITTVVLFAIPSGTAEASVVRRRKLALWLFLVPILSISLILLLPEIT